MSRRRDALDWFLRGRHIAVIGTTDPDGSVRGATTMGSVEVIEGAEAAAPNERIDLGVAFGRALELPGYLLPLEVAPS